jgi:hypothetical protein
MLIIVATKGEPSFELIMTLRRSRLLRNMRVRSGRAPANRRKQPRRPAIHGRRLLSGGRSFHIMRSLWTSGAPSLSAGLPTKTPPSIARSTPNNSSSYHKSRNQSLNSVLHLRYTLFIQLLYYFPLQCLVTILEALLRRRECQTTVTLMERTPE